MKPHLWPTREFGAPRDETRKKHWPNYAAAPWKRRRWPLSAFVKASRPDLVFVDGRFRVACILTAVLNSRPDAIVMVHDFWNRPHYHAPLPFLEEIEKAETMAVFRIRPGFKRSRAKALLSKARYDFR
ncbi:MAG: hypothetical protein JSS54_13205 [Proteobacteria bacterium]|nr:hypothetical protein [Pseudomonadota bacterium]